MTEYATLAGGCFWCTEAVFKDVIGVTSVESGYLGGTVADPTYRQVCTDGTGHAEVVEVTFDPKRISYDTLLDAFFSLHDPTQVDRQGPDWGTQYRSAIFPADAHQEQEAKYAIQRAQVDQPRPIVTTIEPMSTWYPAEGYHQDYWETSGRSNPYCMAVIPPKLQKLRKSFAERTKSMAAA